MTIDQLREMLKDMAKQYGPEISNICKVKSVDRSAATCVTVDDDGIEFFDVRLRPVINGKKSLLLLPKVGSSVLIMKVEQDDYFVVGYDEIDGIEAQVKNTVFEIDETGFLLKKENESLKSIINELIEAIQAMSFQVSTPDTINGTTGVLTNAASFANVKVKFNQLLK